MGNSGNNYYKRSRVTHKQSMSQCDNLWQTRQQGSRAESN